MRASEGRRLPTAAASAASAAAASAAAGATLARNWRPGAWCVVDGGQWAVGSERCVVSRVDNP